MEDNPVVSGGTIRGVRKPSGKGNHLIILHAGGGNGCVNSADLVFQSKKATDDDHDEMKAAHFEEWFHDSLLPNLQSNSLIVMDNAPYHSRNSNLCLPCIGVGNGVQRGHSPLFRPSPYSLYASKVTRKTWHPTHNLLPTPMP